MCSATCVSAVCQRTCACVPKAFCSCAGCVRDVTVWVWGCLNTQTKIHSVIRILIVIISSLRSPNEEQGPHCDGLSKKMSFSSCFEARYVFVSLLLIIIQHQKKSKAVSEFSEGSGHTKLSGNAQCVVRIRPVMCNSSLENSFPLKLTWVLLLHISMLHHTEYIKFDVIFFSSFFPGNL